MGSSRFSCTSLAIIGIHRGSCTQYFAASNLVTSTGLPKSSAAITIPNAARSVRMEAWFALCVGLIRGSCSLRVQPFPQEVGKMDIPAHVRVLYGVHACAFQVGRCQRNFRLDDVVGFLFTGRKVLILHMVCKGRGGGSCRVNAGGGHLSSPASTRQERVLQIDHAEVSRGQIGCYNRPHSKVWKRT